MRIVHLTVVRQLTRGQAQQLRFEYDAAQKLDGVEWTTIAYHNGPVTEAYMRLIPRLFRPLFLRNIWGWLVALRLSWSHDIVMMRHMTFDPFAFIFAPLIRNRVSVHHAKEVEELQLIRKDWRGRAASYLERLSGGFAARKAKMILGVTHEIAEYERDMYASDKPIDVYPNGVDIAQVQVLADQRVSDEIHAAFICGNFSQWHGLDKLITAVDAYAPLEGELPLTIHLIGNLSDKQISEIGANETRRKVFKAYGLLSEVEYRPILEQCDFGITSLALERKSLREASTLKVREMLALGLPVYSGHEDIALGKEIKWARVVCSVSVNEMLEFACSEKSRPRECVRNNSVSSIDKGQAMINVSRRLSSLA